MVDLPCSLRVAVVAFVFIIVVFFAVAFIFLFVFLVWLLSKDDIGGYRPIIRVQVEAFWMYAPHAQWYPCCPLANAACPMPRREETLRAAGAASAAEQSRWAAKSARWGGLLTLAAKGGIIILSGGIADLPAHLALFSPFLRIDSSIIGSCLLRIRNS